MAIKEKRPRITLRGGMLNNAVTTDTGEALIKMNVTRQDGVLGVALYEVERIHREDAYFLENSWDEDLNESNEDYDESNEDLNESNEDYE